MARHRVLGLGEGDVRVLHDAVRRKSAVGGAEVHRPAARMESDADLAGRVDLRLEQSGAALGEHVVVIGRRRAAGERQLGQPDGRRGPLPFGVDAGPHGIQLSEPAEEPLLARPRAGERLVQMMMGVHQAGDRDRAAPVEHLRGPRGSGEVSRRAHPRDRAVLDEDRAAGDLRALVVHRHDDLAALDQQAAHGDAIRSAASSTASRIFW